MFLSAICWLSCLLWLITEFTRKPSWLLALGLSFATYALFMTAYPQLTIVCIYITGAYAVIRTLRMQGDPKSKCGIALALLGCAVAGALTSLPVYLDLLPLAENSVRLSKVVTTSSSASCHRFIVSRTLLTSS